MPCFSEKEKKEILVSLRKEGEKLFSWLGIKKATIDDLCQASNISKGSFYLFYRNKECLYIDIINNLYHSIFNTINEEIRKIDNISLETKLLIALNTVQEEYINHPVLCDILTCEEMKKFKKKLNSTCILQKEIENQFFHELMQRHSGIEEHSIEILCKVIQFILTCLKEGILSKNESQLIINVVTSFKTKKNNEKNYFFC